MCLTSFLNETRIGRTYTDAQCLKAGRMSRVLCACLCRPTCMLLARSCLMGNLSFALCLTLNLNYC